MVEVYHLVVFTLDERRYALPLATVLRILPAVEVTPLPKAPAVVLGIVNVEGTIIPVMNIRQRFHLPEREIDPGDFLIIAHTEGRIVGLVVDSVVGTVEKPAAEITSASTIFPSLEYLAGVVKLDDGVILVHDLDLFLSLAEAAKLDEILNGN